MYCNFEYAVDISLFLGVPKEPGNSIFDGPYIFGVLVLNVVCFYVFLFLQFFLSGIGHF